MGLYTFEPVIGKNAFEFYQTCGRARTPSEPCGTWHRHNPREKSAEEDIEGIARLSRNHKGLVSAYGRIGVSA
jgi:hypothetical protein